MLDTVPFSVVQSIRAFQPSVLCDEAVRMRHHFLHADLARARSRTQVLRQILDGFKLPKSYAKDHKSLYTCLTKFMQTSGSQNGFVVVLEHMPDVLKFGAEAREKLLDVFRDAADFWAERGVSFRVFYSQGETSAEEVINSSVERSVKSRCYDISVASAEIECEQKLVKRRGRKPKEQVKCMLPFMRSVFDTQLIMQRAA